jgi:hypothetical protein
MPHHRAVLVTTIALALAASTAGPAIASAGHPTAGHGWVIAPGASWGRAQELPGTAGLNQGDAFLGSISCGSPGNCSAGGYYTDGSGNEQAFVATQTGGSWGSAQEVPGSGGLNAGGYAQVISVSCASAGNCSAGGSYLDGSLDQQAFVTTESGGSWGSAQAVPGLASLNAGGLAQVTTVSCASAGNCTAGGYYTDNSDVQQAFVVTESGGSWGSAEEVPGSGSLNAGDQAEVTSVSCASAGNCGAGGYYIDGSAHQQAFVATQSGGTWGNAQEVPGSGSLNPGGSAKVTSVSCPSAGNCSATGFVSNHATTESGELQAFVDSESGGTWANAQDVATSLNTDNYAEGQSVSCASAGNCTAGGFYMVPSAHTGHKPGHEQPFLVNETNGTWGSAEKVPNTSDSAGNQAGVTVSCPAAGSCAAAGWYSSDTDNLVAFVENESGGTWGNAKRVPGLAALGNHAQVISISCSEVAHCAAGGGYMPNSDRQVFVVTEP